MTTIKVKQERCKACGLCAHFCPKKCISFDTAMNSQGYFPVTVDTSVCISCGTCYTMCPDTVYEISNTD